MSNVHTEFWTALLDRGERHEQRVRLWNGYVGERLSVDIKVWMESHSGQPRLVIDPPEGGWPELTDQEQEVIETLAERYGGHPKFNSEYMDFSGHIFSAETNFSDLILINSNFEKARFKNFTQFEKSRFHITAKFDQAHFERQVFFGEAQFNGPSHFFGTSFDCGVSFSGASFEAVWFTDAQFSENGFSSGISPEILVDFTNVEFSSLVDFRETTFGSVEGAGSRRVWPERVVDFTGATFAARTSFYRAAFGGIPAFFNATLYEDTNFDGVRWDEEGANRVRPGYAVRAWERLELIMSQLEKPQDRHRFFRFKMRARRRTDGRFLYGLNRLFEITSDYGWGVQRAFLSWLGHWVGFALILFVNSGSNAVTLDWWKLALAALCTGFANAHAFLGLAGDDGYLAASRQLLACNDAWGLFSVAGTVQAILGPTFLFLLLLTLRNRFRLA